jgi:hypothetical protein
MVCTFFVWNQYNHDLAMSNFVLFDRLPKCPKVVVGVGPVRRLSITIDTLKL